jgi:paraquat-inducible protein A
VTSEALAIDDLGRWRECHDCGLFQRLPDLGTGEAAICGRCDAMLHRERKETLTLARTVAVGGALLFGFTLILPLGELHILGRTGVSTVFSGPRALREHGHMPLAIVVVVLLVVMPAVKLAVQLTVLFGALREHPPRWLGWLFGWLRHISPWAMLEVYLLGSFVAYSRVQALAPVQLGPAALALGGATLVLVAVDATLDPEAIWQKLRAGLPRGTLGGNASRTPSKGDRVIGCTECGLVVDAGVGPRCPCCRHPLAARRDTTAGAWAMLIGAALLYIPANVLPVMTVKRLARGGPTTILHGVVELAQSHLFPLALLVLVASVIIPVFKLGSLTVLLLMTRRRSPRALRGRTKVFRFVRFVGRWSMIDIFMLSVLVGAMRFGRIASVTPGMGAAAFCAVVLLTMVATELFDPRLMWDAAGRSEQPVEGRGAPDVVPGATPELTREELRGAAC